MRSWACCFVHALVLFCPFRRFGQLNNAKAQGHHERLDAELTNSSHLVEMMARIYERMSYSASVRKALETPDGPVQVQDALAAKFSSN